MIALFSIYNSLILKLKTFKNNGVINKFFIDLDQRNEINVIIITNKSANEIDFVEDNFNLTILNEKELEDDYYYSDLFLNKGDEVIQYTNSRRKLNNILNGSNDYEPQIPVITYYSYKGGMGRSTNLVLSATHLARHYGKKVVIIDCDFEAPGFSNFYLENPAAPKHHNGLIEYFFDVETSDKINLNDYSWEVSKEYSKNGEIRIIPAGNLDTDIDLGNDEFSTNLRHYLEGLSRIDFSSTEFIVNKFERLLQEISKQFNPDVILIDSRTGFTDIFGIVALKLASHVIGFFSNSVQNDPGIYQFIDSLRKIPEYKKEFRGVLVNAFSDIDFFEEFRNKVNNYIEKTSLTGYSQESYKESASEKDSRYASEDLPPAFLFTPDYFFFRYNTTLAELGTSRERKRSWLEQVDEKEFSKGYVDLSEKLNEFISEYSVSKSANQEKLIEKKPSTLPNDKKDFDFLKNQQRILTQLSDNWPELYADESQINFQTEFDNGKIYYRESMKDIFNFDKFIVLGNKGTGKSYLFQALKNSDITQELKRQAQKTHLNIKFIHLVDKKSNYFISTKLLESFKSEIENIGDFFSKFWKVYTWRAIIDNIENIFEYKSTIECDFTIKNDTDTIKRLVIFISKIDNIIGVEKELSDIDKKLNSEQIDILGIYDNLDLMVEPASWKDQMASLINFWNYSSYKRIHSKLFLRSDLFKKIVGINNSQALKNSIISIEWKKEEIFNYFFNLVKLYANPELLEAVENFDFITLSDDSTGWIQDVKKSFKVQSAKQKDFEEYILRRLCWVFFGQYPDIKAHGESYDWLYKNVMNADETISLRPFIDLLRLSIEEFFKDVDKDSSAVLSKKYYTARKVRQLAVDNHFNDLVKEEGNQYLKNIFDYIDDNHEYKYYEFLQQDFYSLLESVIKKDNLKATIKELEELLIISGIVRRIPVGGNSKYSFAFLYKYRLGLGTRRRFRRY